MERLCISILDVDVNEELHVTLLQAKHFSKQYGTLETPFIDI